MTTRNILYLPAGAAGAAFGQVIFTDTSSGAGDVGRGVLLNALGQIPAGFLPAGGTVQEVLFTDTSTILPPSAITSISVPINVGKACALVSVINPIAGDPSCLFFTGLVGGRETGVSRSQGVFTPVDGQQNGFIVQRQPGAVTFDNSPNSVQLYQSYISGASLLLRQNNLTGAAYVNKMRIHALVW